MKYKRNVIIVMIAVAFYFIVTTIYNRIVIKEQEVRIYVVKEDIAKGETIDQSKLYQINAFNQIESEYLVDLNGLKEKVASMDLSKGQMLTKDVLIEKEKMLVPKEGKELVSLKIASPENGVSYTIQKNELVNVYYTGKLENMEPVVADMEMSNIISGGTPDYMTIKLLEKVKVMGVYDSLGKELSQQGIQNNDKVIDTVVFEVDSKIAMMIYNLQKYGNFSVSLMN